jgi:hypothetical protein
MSEYARTATGWLPPHLVEMRVPGREVRHVFPLIWGAETSLCHRVRDSRGYVVMRGNYRGTRRCAQCDGMVGRYASDKVPAERMLVVVFEQVRLLTEEVRRLRQEIAELAGGQR